MDHFCSASLVTEMMLAKLGATPSNKQRSLWFHKDQAPKMMAEFKPFQT